MMHNQHYSIIKVKGEKATEFLQGQLTCDINNIKPGHPGIGAYCDHKGRVLASLFIFCDNDYFYCVIPKDNVKNIQTELQKFGMFSKVKLIDVSNEFFYGCYEKAPKNKNVIAIAALNNCVLIISKNQTDLPANPLDENAWRLANIETKLAEIYAATSGMFTPHMLNYPALDVVSFNKGCYRGQEIIARTEHLGHSKRCLQKIKVDAPVQPGERLQNNSIVVDIAQVSDKYHVLVVK